jgi:hypothetical protein
MTVVTNPTVKNAPTLFKNGQTGLQPYLTEQAVDAVNGDAIAGLDRNSVLFFRTTSASAINISVYTDLNGVECLIDTVSVPGNASGGGVALYRVPKDVNFTDHNVSCSGASAPADKRAGYLVFKASGAACTVAAFTQIP